MKYKLTFALVASLANTAFAAFQAPLPEFKNEKQLAEWRAEKASESTSQGYAKEQAAFYTGKPYLASSGGYAFKYRSYDPELARWTSEDPSGFPDGANGQTYISNSPMTNFDYLGLVGKSALWVTMNNLFGNGNFNKAGDFNYMADFNGNYTSNKSWMSDQDSTSSGTSSETRYLSDGDIADKHVTSSNSDLLSVAEGYTKVFIITHGAVVGNEYRFTAPDGTAQPMHFFNDLINGSNIIMLTCYDGFSTPGTSGTGATGLISWDDGISAAIEQTRTHLYE